MEISGIITALVVGLVVGALGRLVVPGKQDIPIWLTILIGIAAALIGTVLGAAITSSGILIFIIQVVLAAVGVAIVAGVKGRRRTV